MNDAYDPNAPEDRRSSQYVSRRDVRIVGIVLLVLAIAAWPIYINLLKGMQQSVCKRHLQKIATGLLTYSQDFDDRLPFAYETAGPGDQISPHRDLANTWHWAVKQYSNVPDLFECPAAQPEGNTRVALQDQTMWVSYGMLHAYSGVAVSTVSNAGSRFVIGETVKNGMFGTYDPLPLTISGRPLTEDGFVIGFDNAQTYPVAGPTGKTKFATRLAFENARDSSGAPKITEDTVGRHPEGLNFLFLDGHVDTLNASAMKVNLPGGPYDVPAKPLLFSPKPQAP